MMTLIIDENWFESDTNTSKEGILAKDVVRSCPTKILILASLSTLFVECLFFEYLGLI
jgi:hypothetical protein